MNAKDYDPKKNYSLEFIKATKPFYVRDNPFYYINVLKLVGEKVSVLPGMQGVDVNYCKGEAFNILGQLYYWGVYKEIKSDESIALEYFHKGKIYNNTEATMFYGLLQIKNGKKEGIFDICEALTGLERSLEHINQSDALHYFNAGEVLYIIRQYLMNYNYRTELEYFNKNIKYCWDAFDNPGKQMYVRGLICLYDLNPDLQIVASNECNDFCKRRHLNIEEIGQTEREKYYIIYSQLAEEEQNKYEYREYICKGKKVTWNNPYRYSESSIKNTITRANLDNAKEYLSSLFGVENTKSYFSGIDLIDRYRTEWSTLNTPEPFDWKGFLSSLSGWLLVIGIPVVLAVLLQMAINNWLFTIALTWIICKVLLKIFDI